MRCHERLALGEPVNIPLNQAAAEITRKKV